MLIIQSTKRKYLNTSESLDFLKNIGSSVEIVCVLTNSRISKNRYCTNSVDQKPLIIFPPECLRNPIIINYDSKRINESRPFE